MTAQIDSQTDLSVIKWSPLIYHSPLVPVKSVQFVVLLSKTVPSLWVWPMWLDRIHSVASS